MQKTCKKCLKTKPLSEFYKTSTHSDGYSWQCKTCKSEYWKRWRKDNPVLAREKDIRGNAKKVPGATIDIRKRLYEEQDGKCAICKTPGLMYGEGTPKETLALDHNHATGQLRQLLCIKCNRGLGLFMDDPELLREAARYLERRLENVV